MERESTEYKGRTGNSKRQFHDFEYDLQEDNIFFLKRRKVSQKGEEQGMLWSY